MFSGRLLIHRDILLDWEDDSSQASMNMPYTQAHSDSITTGSELDIIDVMDDNVIDYSYPLEPTNNVGRELFGLDPIPVSELLIQSKPNIGVKEIYGDGEKKSGLVLSLESICTRKVVDMSVKNTLKIENINTNTSIESFYNIFNTFKVSYSSFLRMVGFYTSIQDLLENDLDELPLPIHIKDCLLRPTLYERMWVCHRFDIYFKLMFHYRMFNLLTASFLSNDIGGV